MTDDCRDLLTEIIRNPHDVTLRLTFADAADDDGTEAMGAWAEFVRLQCRRRKDFISTTPAMNAQWTTVSYITQIKAMQELKREWDADNRAKALWEEWQIDWFFEIHPDWSLNDSSKWRQLSSWKNGFLSVFIDYWTNWISGHAFICQNYPITHVKLLTWPVVERTVFFDIDRRHHEFRIRIQGIDEWISWYVSQIEAGIFNGSAGLPAIFLDRERDAIVKLVQARWPSMNFEWPSSVSSEIFPPQTGATIPAGEGHG